MQDLINRQDAISLVDRPIVPTGDAVYDNAREDERASIKDDLISLPSAEPKTGWIPVSERLPETMGEYLVTVLSNPSKHTIPTTAFYNKFRKEFGTYRVDSSWEKWDVVAWMPLPKPYKEDVNDQDQADQDPAEDPGDMH